MRALRALRGLAVVATLAIVAVARPTPARADNIDAAALIGALSDSDKTVRGAAAVALGKLITASTPAATRAQAKTGLEKLLAKESTDSVKKVAQKTLAQLAALDAASTAVTTGGIYVSVDKMASKAEPVEDLRKLMRDTATSVMTKKAKDFMQSWPGGKAPTKKDLTAKSVSGFYVDELTVKQKGAAATISCKINMLIATYPEKSIFGMLTGTASVAGSSDERDIALAKQDCVAAVVEDLVQSKVIPAIRQKAGS